MSDVWGVAEGSCFPSGHRIPENTLECPSEDCDYVRSFDQEQYDFLVACAYGPDGVTEEFLEQSGLPPIVLQEMSIENWNRWRSKYDDTEVRLEGANLLRAELNSANLVLAELNDANLELAELNGAAFTDAELNDAFFYSAELNEANLERATLNDACLLAAELNDANLRDAELNEADLAWAELNGTDLRSAQLNDADLASTDLRNTTVRQAEVDSATHIEDTSEGKAPVRVNTRTDFRGVGLEGATVQPHLLGQLQYCCRRLEWEDWYEDTSWLLEWVTWFFWQVSDYGRSTKRIICTFLLASFAFALLYSLVPDLTGADGAALSGFWFLPRLARAFYFSVVTMTTLGFGDLYANAELEGFWFYLSHAALSVHVVVGYILLGALITRFAIMFQGGVGPVKKPELGPNATWWEYAEHWLLAKLRSNGSTK